MGRRGSGGADVARLRAFGGRFGRSRRLRPNGWTPEEVERRIVGEYDEWAYVFDATGRQVLRKRGTEDGVGFSADELSLLRNSLLIHNHPPQREFGPGDPRFEGGSFSERDIDLALTYDIAEMKVVTPGWRYVLTRPAEGWFPDAESAVAVYREELERTTLADEQDIRRGSRAGAAAKGTRVHRTVVRVAAWGGMLYRREEF